MFNRSKLSILFLLIIFCLGLNFKAIAKNKISQITNLEVISSNYPNLKLGSRQVISSGLSSKKFELTLIPAELATAGVDNLELRAYKLELGEAINLSTARLSLLRKRDRKFYDFSITVDYLDNNDSEIFFDLININTGETEASFSYSFDASGVQNVSDLEDADCDSESFGQCHMDYIMDHLEFVINKSSTATTSISRKAAGDYSIYLPLVGRKRLRILGTSSGSNNFSINQNSSFVLPEKTFIGSSTQNGALEFDGTRLYLTVDGTRKSIAFLENVNGSGGSGNGSGSVTGFNGIVKKTLLFSQIVDNTSAATINVDWSEGNRQKITLGQSANINFSDPGGPGHFTLQVIQDATGSRTLNWPANVKWSDDVTPVLTTDPNRMDIVTCFYDLTNYYCQVGYNFGL